MKSMGDRWPDPCMVWVLSVFNRFSTVQNLLSLEGFPLWNNCGQEPWWRHPFSILLFRFANMSWHSIQPSLYDILGCPLKVTATFNIPHNKDSLLQLFQVPALLTGAIVPFGSLISIGVRLSVLVIMLPQGKHRYLANAWHVSRLGGMPFCSVCMDIMMRDL